MGVEIDWHEDVVSSLNLIGIEVECLPAENNFKLLYCNQKVLVNLISLTNSHQAAEVLALQQSFWNKGIYLIQLWEDIWSTRKDQVIGRLCSILGLNKRLHGRKGKIVVLNQQQTDEFLVLNHIQGSAKSKYKYGLEIDGLLVAVACFSGTRPMKRIGEEYKSIELIRFATAIGFTVTGGFSKLLQHLIKQVKPDDVMSYADRDWSLGQAYDLAGFQLVDCLPPAEIWLNENTLTRYFTHRLPDGLSVSETSSHYLKIFNTGNLKYILYL